MNIKQLYSIVKIEACLYYKVAMLTNVQLSCCKMHRIDRQTDR